MLATAMMAASFVSPASAVNDDTVPDQSEIATVAPATEADDDSGISEQAVNLKTCQLGYDNKFVQIIGSEIRNKTVNIDIHGRVDNPSIAYNPKDYQFDIRVMGKNGLIWQQDDWTGDTKNYNSFWIGTDVTSVSARIIPRNKLFGSATYHPFEVQIVY